MATLPGQVGDGGISDIPRPGRSHFCIFRCLELIPVVSHGPGDFLGISGLPEPGIDGKIENFHQNLTFPIFDPNHSWSVPTPPRDLLSVFLGSFASPPSPGCLAAILEPVTGVRHGLHPRILHDPQGAPPEHPVSLGTLFLSRCE